MTLSEAGMVLYKMRRDRANFPELQGKWVAFYLKLKRDSFATVEEIDKNLFQQYRLTLFDYFFDIVNHSTAWHLEMQEELNKKSNKSLCFTAESINAAKQEYETKKNDLANLVLSAKLNRVLYNTAFCMGDEELIRTEMQKPIRVKKLVQLEDAMISLKRLAAQGKPNPLEINI